MKRQSHNYLISIILCLAALGLSVFPVAADGSLSLAEIRELEKTEVNTEVRDKYIQWLKANPLDGSFRDALTGYLEIEPDPGILLTTLGELLPLTTDKSLKSEILAQAALTEEILGQLEKSSDHYLQASREQGGEKAYPYLLRAARLLLEQGATSESLVLTDQIQSGSKEDILKRESTLLKAKGLLLDDQADKARELLFPLLETTKDTELYPRVLFHYIEALYTIGNGTEAGTMLARLQNLSEKNPDYSIAQFLLSGLSAERIKIIQTPNTLKYLKSFSVTPKSEGLGVFVYVQIGSFSNRENAQALLTDLKAKNFAAEIIEKVIKGKTYFKVVMKTTDNPDEVNANVMKLKSLGYEAFLIKP